ncbi:MAG TPA: hypothetical protein VFM58_15125 [Solirubrobacteraceae bacterium]|nr:hypothetical protein [Solirubrobacteraceae bacterium]
MIVCLAVAPLVAKQWRVAYAALFGAADGLAFLIGAGLGLSFLSEGASTAVTTAIVVGLALYLLVVVAGAQRMPSSWSVWVFPHLLVLDNLTYGLTRSGDLYAQATQQALSSALLAFTGLLVAAWLPRVLPAARASAVRVAGAGLLVAAGALVVVG